MTVGEMCEHGFRALVMPAPDREIKGVYIGDLLSWVMGRAKEDDAWITIMSNINVVAVASLADVSSVVLAEDVVLDDECLSKAAEKNINILVSGMPIYETAVKINSLL